MTKGQRWMVRFDPLSAKRIELRAQERGVSIAEYIRSVVELEIEIRGQADFLSSAGLKYSVVSCLLIRQVVDQVLGMERGADLERSANEKADAFCASLTRR